MITAPTPHLSFPVSVDSRPSAWGVILVASCPIGGDIVLLGNCPGGITGGELSRWDYLVGNWGNCPVAGCPDTMENSLTNAKVTTLTNSKGLCELI